MIRIQLLSVPMAVTLLTLGFPSRAQEVPPLYRTSFESFPVGGLQSVRDGHGQWEPGRAVHISGRHAHSGSKCLHLAGGEDSSVQLALEGELRNSRGLTFQAERWTSQAPFAFVVEAQTAQGWQEVADLSNLIQVGRSFRSRIQLALPEGPLSGLRLRCTAPAGKGALIDDLVLLAEPPARITREPVVANEPIAGKVHDLTLFKSGETYTERITMEDRVGPFDNYAGTRVVPNPAPTNREQTKIYRIPALITAANGDLIAACDARRDHGGDLHSAQDIDIAIRRSSDNGATWSEMEIVCDLGEGHPVSDPSLVLDRVTGDIFCFYNYMDRSRKREYRLWVQKSTDHGKTWGPPRDITDEITLPEWKFQFKFITSGRACQTRDGMLIHNLVRVGQGVHLFGSKDHGKTWFLINETPVHPANESKVIELADGALMVNSRVNGYGTRHVHVSEDGGRTWSGWREPQLVDPGCNGAIIRYTSKADGYAKNRLLFSNANSFQGRKNLVVRISYDEGRTWSEGKVIDAGPTAYSDLTICPDGTIGILYEPGHGEVRFTSITLEDLTDGQDRLTKPYQLPGVRR